MSLNPFISCTCHKSANHSAVCQPHGAKIASTCHEVKHGHYHNNATIRRLHDIIDMAVICVLYILHVTRDNQYHVQLQRVQYIEHWMTFGRL